MSNTSKKLRVLVDSTSAKTGAKEVTSAMGKVVTSGKTTIKTFKELNTLLGQTGTQFSKLNQMQKSYNPFATLEKSIQSYTKQMASAMTQGQTFTVKLKEGNAQVTRSLKDTETQTKKTAGQFIKLKGTSVVPLSTISKEIAALSKAMEKLNNTMYAEQARTKALNTELGKNSVKVQEQRRLTEELARSKSRLNSTYSDEYVQLIRTRKAIEDRNKEIRNMDMNVTKTRKSVGNLNSSFSMLGTTLAGLSIYFSATGLVRQADAYTNLTNKLAAVTQGTVDTTNATRELLAMSIENRSSMEGTMDVYTKMIRVNETLGKSQQEVVNLTEAISKSVAMSGASAQGAQGAIMQFGQAMASNFAASAQELNSILEQTPSLAYYMVKGINEVDASVNLTTSTLKKFAEEGNLSSELVFEAFQRVLPQIQKDFDSTTQTVESATQNLSDSFSVLIGELDDGYGITDSIVGVMTELAEVLPDMKDEVTALTVGLTALISTAALGGVASLLLAMNPVVLGVVAGITALSYGFTKLYLSSTQWERAAETTSNDLEELMETSDKFKASLMSLSASSLDGLYGNLSSQITEKTAQLEQFTTQLEASKTAEETLNRRVYVRSDNFMSEDQRNSYEQQISDLSAQLTRLNDRLAETKKSLDSVREANAFKALADMSKLTRELESDISGLSSEYKTYQKELDKIDAQYSKSAKTINQMNDSKQKSILLSELMAESNKAESVALQKYASEVTTVKDLLDQATIKDGDLAKATKLYNTQIAKLKEVYKEQKAIYDLQLKNDVISPEDYDVAVKQLDAYKTELEGLYEDALTKGEDFDWAKAFEGASPAFIEALSSGDFSSIGDSIGSIIGSYASSALGTGLLAQAGGGLIGAAAGYAVSSLFSSYESTGSTSNLSVSGSGITGYNKERFEKSGLFGGSKSVVTDYTSNEISAISNTVSEAQRSITSLLGSMGTTLSVSVEDFSTTVSADDIDGAIEEITEEFLDANVAYIESFQSTNQTAIEALADIAEAWGALENAFDTLNLDALESSVDNAVTGIANSLTSAYEQELVTYQGMRDELLNSIADATEGIDLDGNDIVTLGKSSFWRGERDYSNMRVLTRYVQGFIDEVDKGIAEINSRIVSVYEEAYTTFTMDLEDAVADINNVDTEDAWSLLAEQVANYSENFYSETEQFQNAMEAAAEDLEQFSDLGIDSSTSLDEFREAFEAFSSSDAFSAEGYAEWMAAASALSTFNNAFDGLEETLDDISDEIEDTFSSITDWLEEMMGLSESGTKSLLVAQTQYNQQLALAQSGDEDAIESLTSYADNVLEAAETESSSAAEYNTILAQLVATMSSLATDAGVDVPEYATGGNHEGGWRVVGDGGNGSGTELEYTGTSQIFNGKQASTLIDVEGLQQELGEIRMILRSGMGTIAKNTNKSYKVLDRWDNVGIPQERDF